MKKTVVFAFTWGLFVGLASAAAPACRQLEAGLPHEVILPFPQGLPKTVRVLPLSFVGDVAYETNAVRLCLKEPVRLRVDFGGEAPSQTIFVRPRDTVEPRPTDLYFAPGTHQAGEIVPKAGTRVILARGAVVRGTIRVRRADGVSVVGGGILDATDSGADAAVTVEDSSDVQVSGIQVFGPSRSGSVGLLLSDVSQVAVRDVFVQAMGEAVRLVGGRVRNVTVSAVDLDCGGTNVTLVATGADADVRDVSVQGCRLWDALGCPVAINAADADVRTLTFSDFELDVKPYSGRAELPLFAIAAHEPEVVFRRFRLLGDKLPPVAVVASPRPGTVVAEGLPAFALRPEGAGTVRVRQPRAYVKVVTSNVKCPAPWDTTPQHHWTARSPRLFAQWRAMQPDILNLQEPVKAYLDEIAAAFPELDCAGVAREDGREEGEYGPVLWRRDRFDCVRRGTFWLSETPETAGSRYPGANHPRICTFAYLHERVTGRLLAVYNTHTSYVSDDICRAQLAIIVRHMAAHAPEGAVRILTGDLNFEAGRRALAPLADAGLANADDVCAVPLDGLWNSVTLYRFYPRSFPAEGVRRRLATAGGDLASVKSALPDLGNRIDHIFLSPGVSVTACGVDDMNDGGWYPSDHMPKFAVLDLGCGDDPVVRRN